MQQFGRNFNAKLLPPFNTHVGQITLGLTVY